MLRLSTNEDLRALNAIKPNLRKEIFVTVVSTYPKEKSQSKTMLEFSLKAPQDIKRMLGTSQTRRNILPGQLASQEIILLLGL